jgi:hypothetical protein
MALLIVLAALRLAIVARGRATIARSGLIAWLLVSATSAAAQPTTTRSPEQSLESEVKAVFLYNFTKYVDWPAPQGSSASIRICVPADPDFLALVRGAVRDEVVNGRPLSAVGLDGLDAARDCDILYVGDAATPDAAAWIHAVRGRQVLIVGDGALADGVVIAFVRDQNRVRFDINRQAASRQKLSISSRLLGLARRVTP